MNLIICILLVALFTLLLLWLKTQNANAPKTWTLMTLLGGALVLSTLAQPLEAPVRELTTTLAVLVSCLGGSAPAIYFVGKIKQKQTEEKPKGQHITGTLGILNLRADITQSDERIEAEGGGRLIGIFERLAVALCLITAQTSALAVIVAIKGLARYPDIKAGHLTAEKFIVGTFVSLLWAAGCVLIAVNLR